MAWLEHVKQYRAANPGVAYKDALTRAKATYRPPKGKQAPKRGKGPVDFLQNLGARLTERPGQPPKNRLFPGEKHALLWNADLKRYEPAMYMGPGTHVNQRVRRGDVGVSPSDVASKAHDLRYTLGTSKEDIDSADAIFYAVRDRLRANKQDVPWNLNQMSLLRIKDLLPFIGSTYSGKDLPEDERALLSSSLAELEKQGYGTSRRPKRPARRR